MRTLKTMETKNIFGFLVVLMALVLTLVFITPTASAFAEITQVVINGIEIDAPFSGVSISGFAGETIGVRITFEAVDDFDNVTDVDEEVRVSARILGEPGTLMETEEFAVIEGNTYSRLLNLKLPFDLNEKLDEPLDLEVTVESRNQGVGDKEKIDLHVQRENELIEVLAVESENEVMAGEQIVFDVVVKNRGRHLSEDTFVRVSIPSLGISKMVFLGDLSAFDQGGLVPDKEDSGLARIFLKIPRNAPAGVYNVEIEAFDDDSTTLATRKLVVVGADVSSDVISSKTSKKFAVGEEKEYTVTIVNADDRIKVYELILESSNENLEVSLEDSIVAVPAGSSKTVKLTVKALDKGTFNFAVNVHSESELVKRQEFVADVEGRKAVGNAALVLTIILAIIFVVLLIVLIVLLTRKPQKSGEFGESYY